MPWRSTFLVLVLMSFGCYAPSELSTDTSGLGIVDAEQVNSSSLTEPTKVLETFVDDLKIGRPKRNKIKLEILEGSKPESSNQPQNIAKIQLYSITQSKEWKLKQTIELETRALMEAEPEIKDFNNDGLKDITFISNSAARGANEIRTLLIYDKYTDSLIHIKNSEDYPNLAYNKTLKCIDSWMVHGTSSTVFLRLEGEELKEFASVGVDRDGTGNCCRLVVSVIDKSGQEKVIHGKKISEDEIYTRYRNFDPPRP